MSIGGIEGIPGVGGFTPFAPPTVPATPSAPAVGDAPSVGGVGRAGGPDFGELVLDGLGLPGLAALGYLPPDALGECRRVAGSAPQDDRMRGDVVFLELRELPYGGRWQLRGFGSPAALSTLARACAPLAVGLVEPDPTTYADRSVVLELAGRPTVVQELVEHLDSAGLDGHVRVLRIHDVDA